ncbi:MAG: hypothetical protein AB7U38_06145 [Hyphomicrobiales bacterium]
MGLLIYFGALWLAVSALGHSDLFADGVWGLLLPGAWLATLAMLKN